ncbi:hypothetical protein Dda_2463 [Drechslerella dactyloides]|uniref:Uncharacterized protein n=1 Tax=Drechslerella dactyloides TaxID=74499 RepID=A0AAD6IZM7_DREDA|nr:hypothetical protein Dda_2463 [Drechslerella dactyloides]
MKPDYPHVTTNILPSYIHPDNPKKQTESLLTMNTSPINNVFTNTDTTAGGNNNVAGVDGDGGPHVRYQEWANIHAGDSDNRRPAALHAYNLHIAIDVSGNGKLPPSSYQALPNGTVPDNNAPTFFHSIAIYFVSRPNGHNLTISNNSVPPTDDSGYVGPILALEEGSTVKHVNWAWPDCLSGINDLGEYNISIHQSFVWNSTEYYGVFDLPVVIRNGRGATRNATGCGLLNNLLLRDEDSDSNAGVVLGPVPDFGLGVTTNGSAGNPSPDGQNNGQNNGNGQDSNKDSGRDGGDGGGKEEPSEGAMEGGMEGGGRGDEAGGVFGAVVVSGLLAMSVFWTVFFAMLY